MKKLIYLGLIFLWAVVGIAEVNAALCSGCAGECAYCRKSGVYMGWTTVRMDAFDALPVCSESMSAWSAGSYYGSWVWTAQYGVVRKWCYPDGPWCDMTKSTGFRAATQTVYEWIQGLPVCPDDINTPPTPPITDTDEDGVDDPCDPWPNENNAGTMWVPVIDYDTDGLSFRSVDDPDKWFDIGDTSGNPTVLIGEDPMEFSDILNAACDPDDPINVQASSPPSYEIPLGGGESGNATATPQVPSVPTPSLADSGGASGNATATPQVPDTYTPDPEDPCCPAMETAARNSTKLVDGQNDIRDYLAALQGAGSGIEANTRATAENTGKLVLGQNDVRDYLSSLQKNSGRSLSVQEDILAELQGDNETVYDIQGEVEAALDTEKAEAEAEASSQLDSIDTHISGLEYPDYDQETDVPSYSQEQTDYEEAVGSVKTDSGLGAVAEDVGVGYSGAVTELHCSVWGQNIYFDFSTWESFYDLVGVAFLSLCYLTGFLIILRG